MKKQSFLLIALVAYALSVSAQQQTNPCSTEQAHQFDFWIGEWNVYKTGTDTIVGHNIIKPIANGCALLENWSGGGGSIGNSINKYNFTTKKWQQMWVDNGGTTLEITGNYQDGKMIMENEQPGGGGKGTVKNKITWTNNSDGSVRQYWQYSRDQGKTWQVAFDGMYKKVTQ